MLLPVYRVNYAHSDTAPPVAAPIVYNGEDRRWIFSSRWLISTQPYHAAAGRILSTVFPDDCRVCGQPLREFSRIPVCSICLRTPEPLEAEFFCAACRTPFLNRFPLDDHGLCTLCRLGLSGFDAAYTYGAYDGPLRRLIHLFKYEGVEPLAAPLGDWMLRAFPRQERFDAVAPMPLHWLRRWRRGFNQAELLARHIAGSTGIPILHAVRRRRPTAPQAGLTNAGRRANVAGAFQPRSGVKSLRILLVDDVITTGATAGACAAALKRAGAARVCVLTVARADRRMPDLAGVS